MCGISAIFSNQISEASSLLAMTNIIRHRGPDDEGFLTISKTGHFSYFAGPDTPEACRITGSYPYLPAKQLQPGNTQSQHDSHEDLVACLGHRRLSIVDTSPAGHQPMTLQNRLAIVYNGEVYNHIEIRLELESLGRKFYSHSDTEVILHAYDQWGTNCLQKFNGMFAFVIYDKTRDFVFAARDRFGVKPLYYYQTGSAVAFASEIKQFTVLPSWQAKLNKRRSYDFLVSGIHEHTDETFFDGVYQVPPGGFIYTALAELIAKPVRSIIQKWYVFPEGKHFHGSFEEAADIFRELLTDSVRLRLRADVPVGSCLSGGLDSSAIVCIMSDLLKKEGSHNLQKTFSACAREKAFDEREFIDAVVQHTGVQGHYVYPQLKNLFEISDDIVWHQDQPYGSTSIFAQWNVFKLASEHNVKVMLDGQGADEQLGGYASFFNPWLASLARSLHWVKLAREARALNRIHGVSQKRLLWFIASSIMPIPMQSAIKHLLRGATQAPAWLNMQRMGFAPYDLAKQIGISSSRSIRSLSYAQLNGANLQMLLHYEDRDSMAHSIESRVPFLDYRLVEHVYSLPDTYKISGGQTKFVLREGLKNTLPEKIYNRNSKLGFATPEEVWIRKENPDEFRKRLKVAIEVSGGIVQPEILKELEEQISGRQGFSFLPWRVISFSDWIRIFKVNID